jgi:thioesterase domain-containing protein
MSGPAISRAPSLRLSPYVLLKDGNEAPPILIAHGLSGTVQVHKLAKHIYTDHPVYGIQAKGIDGQEEPFDRIEDMASHYIDELDKIPCEDSYILVGYSFGGLVALELAQRLQEKGREIPLLVFIDTYPHQRFMRFSTRSKWFLQRMRGHLSHMRDQSLIDAASYFLKGIKRRLYLSESVLETAAPQEVLSEETSRQLAILQRVKQCMNASLEQYNPRFYPGKIKFITTETKTFFPSDPATVWKHLVAEFEVEVVPGDHLNVVTTEFKSLAELLTRYIAEATRESVCK